MILYPAIDLKDGQCVRLLQGDMDKATVFNNSPAEQALAFQNAGCEWLHLVDLNGAFEGWPVNGNAVQDILNACPDMKIQLGGGIRDMIMVSWWMDRGISRVILGTAAAEDPDLVREAVLEFPNKIAVGIDARDGFVATHGWAETTTIRTMDLAQEYEDSGVAAIIYTDITLDGAMKGPNIITTTAIANSVNIPVIASGGVSNMDNLRTLKSTCPRLNGIISGRAIYDKKIDITEAINLLKPC